MSARSGKNCRHSRTRVRQNWQRIVKDAARERQRQLQEVAAQYAKPTVTNSKAYPFWYDGRTGGEWRVWRPDRQSYHFGHYATEERAQKSADRINAKLEGGN